VTWVKGQSGNPEGRRRAGYTVEELFKAIKGKGGIKERKPLLNHLIDRAYQNDKVLVAVAGKLFPDLSKVDHGLDAAKELIGHISTILEASRASARKRSSTGDT